MEKHRALNSRPDFIHKMRICLKELKETRVCLKVISKAHMIKPVKRLDNIKSENEQLIPITAKSLETAKKNLNKEKKD
jgi:four helix bundle protein